MSNMHFTAIFDKDYANNSYDFELYLAISFHSYTKRGLFAQAGY